MLAAGKDEYHFLPAVTNLSVYGCIAGTIPSLAFLIKKWLYTTTPYPPSVIGKITQERVHDRLSTLEKSSNSQAANDGKEGESFIRQDMLAGFMNSTYPNTSTPIETPEAIALATSVISAGSDTTAIALSAFFYFILRHPVSYARIQAEVDAAYEEGHLGDEGGGHISYAQGVKLDYLQACLKEAMRLIPPFAMDLLRVVPSEGLLIGDNVFLPPGTEVGTNAYAFNRSVGAFGEQAESFIPERWLNLAPAERSALERNFLSVSKRCGPCVLPCG